MLHKFDLQASVAICSMSALQMFYNRLESFNDSRVTYTLILMSEAMTDFDGFFAMKAVREVV